MYQLVFLRPRHRLTWTPFTGRKGKTGKGFFTVRCVRSTVNSPVLSPKKARHRMNSKMTGTAQVPYSRKSQGSSDTMLLPAYSRQSQVRDLARGEWNTLQVISLTNARHMCNRLHSKGSRATTAAAQEGESKRGQQPELGSTGDSAVGSVCVRPLRSCSPSCTTSTLLSPVQNSSIFTVISILQAVETAKCWTADIQHTI